jgi:leucyl/phenylalanyl-tRNA--protein transferase
MPIVQLGNDPNGPFPAVSQAAIEPNGLLAWGGDLSPVRLLNAYRHGIFPWYNEGQPILWWSPRPRAVIYPPDVYISRRLKRRMRSGQFTVTADQAFAEVVKNCAECRQEGTWITTEMAEAYNKLHTLGFAHSVEVWQGKELAGGLYGLAIGKVFFAESMFSCKTDASKTALVSLCAVLDKNDFAVIDCQLENPHLKSMGAVNIPRKQYIETLRQAITVEQSPDNWQAWFQG